MGDTDWHALFSVIAMVSGLLAGAALMRDHMARQAVERGYALHCPADGNFAWKGECDGR